MNQSEDEIKNGEQHEALKQTVCTAGTSPDPICRSLTVAWRTRPTVRSVPSSGELCRNGAGCRTRSYAADGCGTSLRTPRILARATRIQVAEVPRANLLRVCKRLQPGCKPTDAEDSTDDGNRITHSSKFVIWLVLYTVRP